MADAADEAAKAEKLAAAKKRFEQMKKKGKKAGKGTLAAAASPTEKTAEEGAVSGEPGPEAMDEGKPDLEEERHEAADSEAPTAPPDTEPAPSTSPTPPAGPAHARTASQAARRTPVSHYRRPSINAADVLRSANKSPLSPTDVPDIYRRQAETISTLTEDNEKLTEAVEKLRIKEKKLGEVEAEKDKLQEQLAEVKEGLRGAKGRIDGAEDGKKKNEEDMEKMKAELAALNRQSSHLTSQITAKDRTIAELRVASSGSSNSQDRESLTAKEDQIENMEIDLNKLRNELERAQKSISQAEDALKAKETAYDSLQEELSSTQKDLESANAKVSEHAARFSALESQLEDVQKELETAKSEINKKNTDITSLDKDHHTLKALYRDTETKSQESSRTAVAKAREAQDLEDALGESKARASLLESEKEDFRIRLERALVENRKLTGSSPTTDEEVDELEDAERSRLRERVRVLEEQLESERKHHHHNHAPLQPQQSAQTRQARGMSLVSDGSFLSDDADFGKEMMAARQKEEAAVEERKRAEMERLERVREVKRGLEKWKGWRIDLTLVGGSAHGLGEMFEV